MLIAFVYSAVIFLFTTCGALHLVQGEACDLKANCNYVMAKIKRILRKETGGRAPGRGDEKYHVLKAVFMEYICFLHVN